MEGSEDLGRVSARALLDIIRGYTVSWPNRFGKDKYRVFIEKVVEAFEVLGIHLKSDPSQKDQSHNDFRDRSESHA